MGEAKVREIKITLPEELFNLFLPSEAHTHLIRAKKELLLALRALINARIEMLEKKEEKKEEKKKKIPVE